MEKGLYELKIDPEFKNFLPALSEEKTQNLRDSLIANGCIDPIVTWNGIIIDEHNRYGICQELKIPFDYVEKDFADRDEAKFFMLQTQVCRRELTVFQKCEIVYPFEAFVAEQVEKQRRKAISIYRKNGETSANLHWSQDTGTTIAEYVGTKRRMWYMAKALIEEADEEAKKLLRAGELKIYTAYKSLRPKKDNEDEDYDENEDQRLREMIRAMPKENTTDPRADAVIKDEVPDFPVERIGGYEPAVFQEAPITMSSEEPKRIPGDFYYVEEQTKYSMRSMLDNLKIGLYWLRDEDCNRRDEILSIVEEGFNDAKKLIEQETRR